MPLDDFDAATAFSFYAEVDGIAIKSITEASGLKLETDVIELKMNNEQGQYVIRKLAGRPKAGEIQLTRHYFGADSFSSWMEKVGLGQMGESRKNGFVVICDTENTPIKRFQFINGFVKSLELSNLQAGSTNPVTEKVTISYEQLSIVP